MFNDYIPDYTEQHSIWEAEQDRLYEQRMRDRSDDLDEEEDEEE